MVDITFKLMELAGGTLLSDDLTPAKLAELHRRSADLVSNAGHLAGQVYQMVDLANDKAYGGLKPDTVFEMFGECLAEARKLEPATPDVHMA